jgi:nucleoside phosphorylase
MPQTIEELRGRVDFAIITIKVEELAAVLDQFDAAKRHVVQGARDYVIARVARAHQSEAIVAITRCPAQGNGVAQDVARDIIDELDPQWILVVGIAGAVPATEFSLGDVVLASHVLDFSVAAVKHGAPDAYAVVGREVDAAVENYVAMVGAHRAALGTWADLTIAADGGARRPLPRPPIELFDEKFYGDDAWKSDARSRIEAHANRAPARPLVTAVTIGSSDRLITSDETLTVWLRVARQVRAVEMESAGVHIAARGRPPARKAYPTMSIRGISDVIGYARDDAWTYYACHAAAAFAFAFVRSPYVTARHRVLPVKDSGKHQPSRPWWLAAVGIAAVGSMTAYLLVVRDGVPSEIAKLKSACDGGSSIDCTELANAYFQGKGVPKDLVRGMSRIL